MGKFISLIGVQSGKLTVLRRAENKGKHIYYECLCECGNKVNVRNDKIHNGQAISCGCTRRKRSDCVYDTKTSKLYKVYTSMKQRCFNSKCVAFKNYGGRGITVCEEWLGPQGYMKFSKWAHGNGYKSTKFGECTLDRIDVNKNYEPQNCRWITIQNQQNNTTRNVVLSCNGEKHNIKEWSLKRNIPYHRLLKRLKLGWDIYRALEYREAE